MAVSGTPLATKSLDTRKRRVCCLYTAAKCRGFFMKYHLLKSLNVIQRYFNLENWEHILKFGSINKNIGVFPHKSANKSCGTANIKNTKTIL